MQGSRLSKRRSDITLNRHTRKLTPSAPGQPFASQACVCNRLLRQTKGRGSHDVRPARPPRAGVICMTKQLSPVLCIFMSGPGVADDKKKEGKRLVTEGSERWGCVCVWRWGAPAGHTNSTLIDSTSSPLCAARAYCSGSSTPHPALKCIDSCQPFRCWLTLLLKVDT